MVEGWERFKGREVAFLTDKSKVCLHNGLAERKNLPQASPVLIAALPHSRR